jgi:hypothetical protein
MSNEEQNGAECMPSTSQTSEGQPPQLQNSKRNYLEISELDKYKNLLIKKPLETKKFKPSEALDRVRQFLPNFMQSTDKLLDEHKDNPAGVSIEDVTDESEQHIEMNLALIPESDSDSDDEDSDEDEDEDEEESENGDVESSPNSVDDLQLGFKARDPNKIKRLKLNTGVSKKPNVRLIQVIDNDQETESSSSLDTAGPSTSSKTQNAEEEEIKEDSDE